MSTIVYPYLVTIIVAWFGAHLIKYIILKIKKERPDLKTLLFVSGGMPSSHSATSVALLTIIGLRDGTDSGLFGIAALFAMIVMHDAVRVRRSTGEQGAVLQALIQKLKSKIVPPPIIKGHTLMEVVVGAGLGLVIGVIVHILT